MNTKSLRTFLNIPETLDEAKDGIFRKKGNIELPKDELKKFFDNFKDKEFKNAKELELEINNFFKIELSITTKDVEYLIKSGFISKEGRKLKVISLDGSSSGGATTIKSLSKGTAKKLKVPAAKNNSKFEKFTKTVILNMLGTQKGKLLLVGDPGTGKCLEKNYKIELDISEELYKEFLEFKESSK